MANAEVKPENIAAPAATGNMHPAMHPAMNLVRRFLDIMEQRDLPAAKAMLAPGFEMTFPGDARMQTLEQLVQWARTRYAFVRKRYDVFDLAPGPDGSAVVYCFGTLYGELLSGKAFSGIRFIDRFTVANGLLVDQRVWNDMAEVLR